VAYPLGDSTDSLTPAQIAAYAYQAGFRGAAQVKAVAIALAESGGHPGSLNPRAPDYSVGLWQVNYYGGLLGPRTAAYGTPASLTDPAANARAAFSISGQGKNFGPWSTYTNGAYLSHMAAATAAVGGGGGGGGILGSLGSAASSVGGAITGGIDSVTGGNFSNGLGVIGSGVSAITGAATSGVSDLVGGVESAIAKTAITAVLLAGGVALVVLGLFHAAAPSIRNAAGPAAGMAGAL
jgi:hypothetical protein